MEIETIIKVGVIVVIGGVAVYYTTKYFYHTYNELIATQLQVQKQYSNVEVHLKQKFDLLPALMEVVKDYGTHEKGTFEEVTKMRSDWGRNKNNKDDVKTANMLEGTISKLLNIQEQYPELKADRRFQDIQKSIAMVERQLVDERKLYNEKVEDYNLTLRLFPSNIVARTFKFEERDFFSNGEGVKK